MSKYSDARVCSWFMVCLSDRSAASSFLLVSCYCFIFNIKSIRTFRGIILVSHFRLRLRFSSSWFRCCCFSYMYTYTCSRYILLFYFIFMYMSNVRCRCRYVYNFSFLVLFYFICALVSARYARAAKRYIVTPSHLVIQIEI